MIDDASDLVVLAAVLVVGLFAIGGIGGVVFGALDALAQGGQIPATEQTTGEVTSTVTSFDVDEANSVEDATPVEAGDSGSNWDGDASSIGYEAGLGNQYAAENRKEYVVRVGYQYTVDGETYTAETPYPENVRETLASKVMGWHGGTEMKTTDLSEALDLARRFERGSQVTVYYESSSPEDSFLVRRYSVHPYGVGLGGLMIVGIFVVPFAWFALAGSWSDDTEDGDDSNQSDDDPSDDNQFGGGRSDSDQPDDDRFGGDQPGDDRTDGDPPGDDRSDADPSEGDDSGGSPALFLGFWGAILVAGLAFPVHFWLTSSQVSLWMVAWGLSEPLIALLATIGIGS